MAENEKLVRSVRADKKTFERLAKLADEFGESQGAALEALINLWDTQQAKGALAGRKSDVEDFDSHLHALQRAFLHSLDLAQNAEARALDNYRATLESKDQVIKGLQDRVAALEAQAQTTQQEMAKAVQDRDAAVKATAAAQAAQKAAEDAKDSALSSVADKQAIIEALNQKLVEAASTASTNETASQKLAELQIKYDAMRASYQAEAEIAKVKAETERERAVREAEANAQSTIIELMRQVNDLTLRLAESKSAAVTSEDINEQ